MLMQWAGVNRYFLHSKSIYSLQSTAVHKTVQPHLSPFLNILVADLPLPFSFVLACPIGAVDVAYPPIPPRIRLRWPTEELPPAAGWCRTDSACGGGTVALRSFDCKLDSYFHENLNDQMILSKRFLPPQHIQPNISTPIALCAALLESSLHMLTKG